MLALCATRQTPYNKAIRWESEEHDLQDQSANFVDVIH